MLNNPNTKIMYKRFIKMENVTGNKDKNHFKKARPAAPSHFDFYSFVSFFVPPAKAVYNTL